MVANHSNGMEWFLPNVIKSIATKDNFKFKCKQYLFNEMCKKESMDYVEKIIPTSLIKYLDSVGYPL